MDLERLPFGLAVIYQELLHHYRQKASGNITASSARLLGRLLLWIFCSVFRIGYLFLFFANNKIPKVG